MTAATFAPPFAQLAVLDDCPPRAGALNMALDEILLARLEDHPVLRIYRWDEPTVSFGYFEPWSGVADQFPARKLVRRWTGGGAVEHGTDLTYSLLVPRSHSITNGRAGESYRLIHLALRQCFSRLGWGILELSGGVSVAAKPAVRACFTQPVEYDLMEGDRKLGGAAQRRTRAGLLHQGSLRIPRLAGQNTACFVSVLADSFAEAWAPRALSNGEETAAQRLAEQKYAAQEWLRRC